MSQTLPIAADPRFRVSSASAGQSVFSIPFPWLSDADITVEKTDTNGVTTTLTRPTHYTLSGKGNPAGGSLTLKPGFLAKSGEIYTIVGAAVLSRSSSVVQGGRFVSSQTDTEFDRLTIIAQELKRDLLRALKADYGVTPPSVAIGAAGTVPKWDTEGNLVEGPNAAALEAVEAALAVEAGRALVHGEGASDPYNAGSRKLINLADGVEAGDGVNKGQLDALELAANPDGTSERLDALELGWSTGDFKFRFDTSAPTGWLTLWGGTIGDATSGASRRANDDTEDLFAHFWNRLDNTALPIFTQAGSPTSRGASAAEDFAAHKRLTIPDLSDRFPRAASASARVMGTKEANQNKSHSHTASFSGSALPSHNHTIPARIGDSAGGGVADGSGSASANAPTSSTSAGTPAGTVTVNSNGGDEARPDSYCLLPLVKL